MQAPFHLAFPVNDLESTREFYVNVLGCDTGRCRACWSDLDYDSVDRFRVFTDGGVDVLPPSSEGFGGGETTFLYAMCVDKQGEEPGLDCVPPY